MGKDFRLQLRKSMYRDRFVEFAALAITAVAIALFTYAKMLF